MSLQFGQHNSGLVLSDELREPMPLPDILIGTTFVSANGRMYRLFGDEEEETSLPIIPPLPSVLSTPKASALSLEEALQQIELFQTNEKKRGLVQKTRPDDAPTIRVIHMKSESSSVKPVQQKVPLPKDSISAADIISEGVHCAAALATKSLSVQKAKREQLLHILEESVDEPLIIPFTPPSPCPEESKTETITLKIVSTTVPTVSSPRYVRKYRRQHEKVLYRKPCQLPSAKKNDEKLETVLPSSASATQTAFQWPEQLDVLMQTAASQICMLADHLLVQSNQGTKAICFKSVFPGDGCSTILLCAVRALLERHYRILLIDAHRQHIDLPKQLNLAENLAISNDVNTLSESFGFWAWQESQTNEQNKSVLTNLLSTLREEYDLILVDNGSVTESPLSELIDLWNNIALDGVLLINNTKRPSDVPVSHIASRLRQHQIHLVGIAENYV